MGDRSTYEDIRYETTDGIATITLDRPDVYNAFTATTIGELNDALERVATDDGIHATILTGAGNGFCTGADVNKMPNWTDMTQEDYAGFLWSVQNVVRRLRRMAKPSVAAVNGPAIGAGCDFALACDIRIVGPQAVFREGFVNVGLVPGDGGAWLLPRLIGESRAKQYLLTGMDVDAAESVSIGLAMTESPNVREKAKEVASDILSNPVLATKHTNRLTDPSLSFEDYCEMAIRYQWECINDSEHAEVLTALEEDRDPDYDRDYS